MTKLSSNKMYGIRNPIDRCSRKECSCICHKLFSNGWIKCTPETMPETSHQELFVWIIPNESCLEPHATCAIYRTDGWKREDGSCMDGWVTHYQIPTPPEE